MAMVGKHARGRFVFANQLGLGRDSGRRLNLRRPTGMACLNQSQFISPSHAVGYSVFTSPNDRQKITNAARHGCILRTTLHTRGS